MTTPIIEYGSTQHCDKVYAQWGDIGTFQIWRPRASPTRMFLGDYAQWDLNPPTSPTAFISRIVNEDPARPAVFRPDGFICIWTRYWHAEGYFWRAALWSLVAADNYVACGSVCTQDKVPEGSTLAFPEKPSIPGLVCVRKDLCKLRKGDELVGVWSNRHDGEGGAVALWNEPGVNVMLAISGWHTPDDYFLPSNAPSPGRRSKPARRVRAGGQVAE